MRGSVCSTAAGRSMGDRPSRVVLARMGPAWMSYAPSPGLGRVVAGVPLAPLQQLDLLRQFRPDVMVSCTVTMNLAALVSTRAYGRRRVAWILREATTLVRCSRTMWPGAWAARSGEWATRARLSRAGSCADHLARRGREARARFRCIARPYAGRPQSGRGLPHLPTRARGGRHALPVPFYRGVRPATSAERV